ncbi:hypothetical protein GALMADRAFT_213241 [Galerina marginata CBS 339.88]|uniref:Uncharacterized protein n=1 Tax=Galerina marginata (strain CBS 339.88) TaxID=685588 RepID=A0A067SRU0_GALM3|nr:hypothetical protein GALMADRAFT_213241 [Galerina marginata CBS 339.88]
MDAMVDISARLHVRTKDGSLTNEQWKMTCPGSQKVGVGMRVCFSEAGDPITIREGVIGGIRTQERRWVEFWLTLDNGLPVTIAPSITLLVPLDWAKLGWRDCLIRLWSYRSLPDRTPGPFKANELSGIRVPRRFLPSPPYTFNGTSS